MSASREKKYPRVNSVSRIKLKHIISRLMISLRMIVLIVIKLTTGTGRPDVYY